jgi:sigma-E factor negative regulatory protein RseC
MLTEIARVVAVEGDGVWVETIRQTTCGTCAAQKGCGHGLLNQMASGRKNLVKVLPGPGPQTECRIDDQVVISIPESVILKGSLIAYLLPVLCMLGGAAMGAGLFATNSDIGSALGAIVGLTVGFVLVRWHSVSHSDDADYQPTLVEVLDNCGDVASISLQ